MKDSNTELVPLTDDGALNLLARQIEELRQDLRLIRDHGHETRRLQFEHDERKHLNQARLVDRLNLYGKRIDSLEHEAESNRRFHEDAAEPISDVRFARKAARALKWTVGLGAAVVGLIVAVASWKGGPP